MLRLKKNHPYIFAYFAILQTIMNDKYFKYFFATSIAIHVISFYFLIFINNQPLKIDNHAFNIQQDIEIIELDLQNPPENPENIEYLEQDLENSSEFEQDFINTKEQIENFLSECESSTHVINEIDNHEKENLLSDNIFEELHKYDAKNERKVERFSVKIIRKNDQMKKNQINFHIQSINDKKLSNLITENLSACWNAPLILSDSDNFTMNFRIKLNEDGKITDVILLNSKKQKISQTMINNFNRAIIKCIPSEELKNFNYKIWKKIDLTIDIKTANV